MQIASFILVLIFALSTAAQTPSVKMPFDEGTRLAQSGEFERALVSYQAALAASKNSPIEPRSLARLHYNLGVCEYRLGRADKAIVELETAIDLRGGEYSAASYALGMAESEHGNWAKARSAFLDALKTNDRNGEAWFDLAFAYLGENDPKNAEASFRNAIRLKSIDTPLSHNNVGVMLAMRGEIEAAKAEFKAAVRTSGGRLKIAENNLRSCEIQASNVAKIELILAERSKQT